MSAERRHFARVTFDSPARLTHATAQSDVTVLDLSFKGALVSRPDDATFTLGAACELTVMLAGVETAIAMSVEVAHVEPGRLGLLCRSIDLDSMTHLRRLIEVNLGEADLLDRELKALVSG